MDFYRVKGEKPLYGTIKTEGAKNAVLPEIAAAMLTEEPVKLINVPYLSDVRNMGAICRLAGGLCDYNKGSLLLDGQYFTNKTIPYESACKLRTSFLFAGPMLARFGKMKISLPGGCNIGTRPIDLHLKGFEKMGACINFDSGFVEAYAPSGLNGAEIYLDFPSVGATENIMMAACLAKGRTLIFNCAQEPEVRDLAALLCKMGAVVKMPDSECILIEGQSELKGTVHSVLPDRIEAGTYMLAVAATGGNVEITGIEPFLLQPICAKLRESGVKISEGINSVKVESDRKAHSVDVKTLPYPGFPTDLQAQITAFLSTTTGTGVVTETVFESRFNHIGELCRMGAGIRLEGRSAIIEGCNHLTGASVTAKDLRAGAALVIGALCARGETKIFGLNHIDRGYHNLSEKLEKLGADIERCQEPSESVGTLLC
ncbi:MAG: UDP-N-acetylglucosamine 1-carboxyvinyltransferase [Ruminococcaceae bacterium]|nr:UDP-N-acetylglucosamine 1-carboxyvinyltransferase [Oscillospiraceae bacterium]